MAYREVPVFDPLSRDLSSEPSAGLVSTASLASTLRLVLGTVKRDSRRSLQSLRCPLLVDTPGVDAGESLTESRRPLRDLLDPANAALRRVDEILERPSTHVGEQFLANTIDEGQESFAGDVLTAEGQSVGKPELDRPAVWVISVDVLVSERAFLVAAPRVGDLFQGHPGKQIVKPVLVDQASEVMTSGVVVGL